MRIKFLNTLYAFLLAGCCLLPKSAISQDMPYNWQKQIEYARYSLDMLCKGDTQHLMLLNYTHKGVINTEKVKDEIIDSILSKDAPIVIHLPSIIEMDTTLMEDSLVISTRSFPKFVIISIGEVLQLPEIADTDPINYMRQQLIQLIQLGFEYLELEWSYKGKTLNSLCIISNEDKNIVYEPIGGFIITGYGKEIHK